jgi:tetratricopeptide (TPR) repeat protein
MSYSLKMDSAMSQRSRFLRFFASLFLFTTLSGCDYYSDRMSVGQQQFTQGKYPQAEEAFSEATTAAEDGESLYHSLKALANVYEARGDAEKAESVRRHAVRVMGHCLEDKMNGQRPCPVRETDLQISLQAGS